jgi:membrane protein
MLIKIPYGRQLRWWWQFRPTLGYLMETEAHVYALAVSASVLLSFYPFLTVMLSLCRNVFHWRAAEAAIFLAVSDFLPGELGDFVQRNLRSQRAMPLASVVLLLFTANGVFEPLEVALNRAWGVRQNRPYWKNQLVALGLIFACGGLALFSFLLTALNTGWMADWGVSHAAIQNWINLLFFKLAALPISIFALFLVYWLLPNRKIEPVRVAPVAILVGLMLEALKYLGLLLFPLLAEKMQREYGVFQHSVSILLWSFVASLVVLAGAEWTARGAGKDPLL